MTEQNTINNTTQAVSTILGFGLKHSAEGSVDERLVLCCLLKQKAVLRLLRQKGIDTAPVVSWANRVLRSEKAYSTNPKNSISDLRVHDNFSGFCGYVQKTHQPKSKNAAYVALFKESLHAIESAQRTYNQQRATTPLIFGFDNTTVVEELEKIGISYDKFFNSEDGLFDTSLHKEFTKKATFL